MEKSIDRATTIYYQNYNSEGILYTTTRNQRPEKVCKNCQQIFYLHHSFQNITFVLRLMIPLTYFLLTLQHAIVVQNEYK